MTQSTEINFEYALQIIANYENEIISLYETSNAFFHALSFKK